MIYTAIMNHWYFIFIAVIPVNTIFTAENETDENPIVYITTSSNIKYITVPTSNNPLLLWIEVRRGEYPNITNTSPIKKLVIGEPLTLLIFYKDPDNLYRIKITDCWAYDNQILSHSKQKLHIYGNRSKRKIMTDWKKGISENNLYFLYSIFTAFKFPEEDRLYLSCDVELLGKEQNL